MMPKFSRCAVLSCFALAAALVLALPATAEEELAVGVTVADLDAPACEAAPELAFLEDTVEEPQAMGCVTCPAEQHACTYHSDCDVYCSGCSGNCIPRKYSVCSWIDILPPKVCQCI